MEERILSGKYRIQREIASGGMGMVYHALDLTLRREVAIKVLHQKYGGDPAFDKRFLQEARGLARLDHPNIVRIYAVEKEDGAHYIVMEYFPAQDLKQLLRERGPLPLNQALHFTCEITKALAYAHQKNIVHRDIKPGNILVGEHDTIKITDFGIAAVLDEPGATVAGTIMGTPEYMSPEQAKGERVDAGSDLYSLGIVFYEMLTGKTPYEGMAGASIVGKLAYDKSEVELDFPSSVPQPLQYLIRGLIRKEPGARLNDASLVLETLKGQQGKHKSSPPKQRDVEPTIVSPPTSKDAPPHPSKGRTAPKHTTQPTSFAQAEESETPPPMYTDQFRKRPSALRALIFGLTGSILLVGLVVLVLYRWPFMGDKMEEVIEPFIQKYQSLWKTEPDVIQTLQGLRRDYTKAIAQQQNTRKTLLGQMNTLLANIHGITPSVDVKRSVLQVNAAEQSLADIKQQLREEDRRQQSSEERRSQRVRVTFNDAARVSKVKLTDAERRSLQENLAAINAAQQQLDKRQRTFKLESRKKIADLIAALAKKKTLLAKAGRQPGIAKPPLGVPLRRSLEEILQHFRFAYENQDLPTLQQSTNMDEKRIKQVKLMFQVYAIIKIDTKVQEIGDDVASAKIVITKLVNRKGQEITPNPIIRETVVRIPKKGDSWGKIQW